MIPLGARGTLELADDAAVEMRCWDNQFVDDNAGEIRVNIERQ